ncbi:MAG: 30S ribosomal protein S9 [Candidatus Andersenbacteria bacterium RIFCSPHIGHO2_12_FULL_45_11b]|uniref:Small ribosomal subunit protein uS9 n=1 Tax=Candidatus Andersenbacteria bacterium RIFCSPHIGHO2_12_FULL_45_11b TaxID=1797282 RepID=A0A1G1X9G5_9BACT|nr:MAG: 30S ribosomal protein S9 [Candidatus Andersenbacteria bacterium RIFCSPHIGHO2_12_FULL_45_11b]
MTSPLHHGLGRRKTAVAKVLLTEEKDSRTINDIPFEQYLSTEVLQNTALRALKLASQDSEYGLKIKVSGSGKNAQAEAISLGIARALIGIDEGFRKQLKQAGLLSRDSRTKERKKPGLKGARRAPQFSKR